MKRQYEKPMQVRWFDDENKRWIGGIAYRDEIICGCCGTILKLSEFKDSEVVEYDTWVNVEEELRGDWDAEEYAVD